MMLRKILKFKIKVLIFLILFLPSLYNCNAINVTTLDGELLFRCEGSLINSYDRDQNRVVCGIHKTFKVKQSVGKNTVYIQSNDLGKNVKLEPKLCKHKFSCGKKKYVLSSTSKKLYGEIEVIKSKGKSIFVNVNLTSDKTNYSYSYSTDANILILDSKRGNRIICVSDSTLNMYQIVAIVLSIT